MKREKLSEKKRKKKKKKKKGNCKRVRKKKTSLNQWAFGGLGGKFVPKGGGKSKLFGSVLTKGEVNERESRKICGERNGLTILCYSNKKE